MMDPDLTFDDTPPEGAVLHVQVGEGLAQAAVRAGQAMLAAQSGAPQEPYFGVSFAQIGQMLAVFTPKRWELVAELRRCGASTVAALARRLGRDYKNVHGDVAALEQWLAVQRLPDGRVHVPWREIVLDMRLPDRLAA
jgi:predicted transcriptional regulator